PAVPESQLLTHMRQPAASVQRLCQLPGADASLMSPPPSVPVRELAPPLSTLSPSAEAAASTHKTSAGRWSGIIRDAILEGDWEPANTLAYPILFNQGQPWYEQHDWKILQQAKKTVKESGIKYEDGRAAPDWLFPADVNSPHDCQNLAHVLLSPSQYIIWQREWDRLACIEAAWPRDHNDPLYGFIADMITGSGAFSNMTLQLNYPLTLHHLAAHLARQSFYAVPEVSSPPAFTNVHQGLTEGYSHLIDRLSQAFLSQPDMTEEAKQTMFKLLAFENANDTTKTVLATLPKGADVGQMLELANHAMQNKKGTVVAHAEAMKPTTSLLAATVQRVS
ncbi:GAK9 protein, partial [Sapayoa aenigma]|nr:GAK9 protein [Sapayoa aenigma]